MNEIKREPHQYKASNALWCPFCGNISVSVMHKEIRFLGMNCFADKKIKMKVYCFCNKCKAAGKPIFYVGYTSPKDGSYSEEHLPIYALGEEAIKAWNYRA